MKKINRRRFLQVGASTFGLGTIAVAWYVSSRESEANQLLEDFPLQIPGASEVRKHKTPRAKHCLVHILQKHYRSQMGDKLDPDVKSVQDNIYDILSYLIYNNSLRVVYKEGLTGAVATESHQRIKEFRELLSKIPSVHEISKDKGSQEAYNKIQQIYRDLYQWVEQKLGASARLELEGKIILKDAESIELAEASEEDFHRGEITERVTDQREDFVLENIVKNRDIFAFCVYGGKHAWGGKQSFGESYSLDGRISYRDNIYEWNIKNPDKKFSLIEIIPQSYKLENEQ